VRKKLLDFGGRMVVSEGLVLALISLIIIGILILAFGILDRSSNESFR